MSRFLVTSMIYKDKALKGFRILDVDNNMYVKDVTYESVIGALNKGANFLNVEVMGGGLTGKGMGISDIPRVNIAYKPTDSRYCDKPDAMILIEHNSGGLYSVANFSGKLISMTQSDINMYGKRIINSKPLVDNFKGTDINNEKFMESVKKEYEERLANSFTGKSKAQGASAGADTSVAQATAQSANVNDEDESLFSNKGRDKVLAQDAENKALLESGYKAETKEEKRLKDAQNTAKIFEDIDDVNTINSKFGKYARGTEVEPIMLGIESDDSLKDIMTDPKTGVSISGKLIKCAIALQEIDMFYYSIYNSSRKIFTRDSKIVNTAAASTDNIYFNYDFVNGMTSAELLFVIMHEISHIALKHIIRGRGRNHQVFNIAGDLFINKLLADEYGCNPDAGIVYPAEDTNRCGIAFMDGSLFSDKVDVKVDTVEGIYDELMESFKIQSDKQQGGQGQNGQGQSGQSQSGQGQSEQSQSGQGQSQSGQGEQGDGQSGQGSDEQGSDEQNNGQGANGQEANKNKDDKSGQGKTSTVEVNGQNVEIGEISFRGKKIKGYLNVDLVESEEDSRAGDSELEDKQNRRIQSASVETRMRGGHMSDFFSRFVELELAPKVRWRQLLLAYLRAVTATETSLSTPDRRFISRNRYLPGKKKLEPDALEGIKICVDTSGSISDEDLSIALSQVKQILDKFKTDAEIIYWDTAVRETGKFKDKQSLLKVIPKGGGGTDINCCFRYLSGLKGINKAKVIVVFTDGYFGTLNEEYVKKFGKHVIWVIPEQDRTSFKKPCGRMAVYEDKKRR